MKKKFLICLGFLIILMLFAYLGILLGVSLIANKWLAFILGALLFLFTFIFGYLLKEERHKVTLTTIAMVVSGLGTGLMISSYFIHSDFSAEVAIATISKNAIFAIAITLSFYCIYALSLNIKVFERHIKLYTYPLLIVLLIFAGILWGSNDKYLYSLVFYYYVMAAIFVFPLIITAETIDDLLLHIVISSFAALLIIAIVTLIIISEGDGFDLDLGGGGGLEVESPKKSKVNDQNLL